MSKDTEIVNLKRELAKTIESEHHARGRYLSVCHQIDRLEEENASLRKMVRELVGALKCIGGLSKETLTPKVRAIAEGKEDFG